jgi:membrane protease YdiL (CAAX protease family)
MLVLKSVAAWLVILVLAMLNGILREAVLLANLSKPVAFVLSGLLLSSFILAVAVALARWLDLNSRWRSLSVGLLWLCLTLIFEFGLGGVVQGRSWAEMLEAYTFKDGNIWPLVLAVTFFAPLVAAHVYSAGESASHRERSGA